MSDMMSDGDDLLSPRTVAKAGAGFAIAGVVLYLFGRVVGWRTILRTTRAADLRWLVAACASTAVALVVWAKAWDVVLAAIDVEIPFPSVVVTYYAATFADYVTPFGRAGGGPLVAYVLSRDDRASFEEGLASVVTADTLNLVPFFVFAGLGVVAMAVGGEVPARLDDVVLTLAVVLLVVPAIGYVLWYERDVVRGAVERVARPVADWTDRVSLAGVRERLAEFYGVLEEIRATDHALAETLSFAFLGWLCFAAPLYFAARSLGIHLAPAVIVFVVPASTLASFVPTPGGLGGVEAAVAGLLVVLAGLPLESAVSVALLYRVASYWFVIPVGGAAALYEVYAR